SRILASAFGGEANLAHARIGFARGAGDEALGFEGAQQAAGVTGIKGELLAQAAHVDAACAARADLEQEARFTERTAALQVIVVQRADALGDGAIEAADLANLT